MTTKRILCISFSPIHRDARVRRQVSVLRDHGEVTTVGYGPAPDGATRHVEVPPGAASLPQTAGGIARLLLRMHRSVELRAPAERSALAALATSERYDLVVANDARALPLAFTMAGDSPVWADLHEWAPEENATSLPWRLLVGPYMDALCRRYLPGAAASTTVGTSIAALYEQRYGVLPTVVRNATPHQDLTPGALLPGRVRLVHSGIAAPERNIEGLIDAVERLDERFTLDLYLVESPGSYLSTLRKRIDNNPRITLHEPVAATDLPAVLNRHDLGVYLLPVRSENHRLMLPNKFFDFVQARLGLVFGPSVETDRLIHDYGLGVVAAGWSADDLVAALESLTDDDIARFKSAADTASKDLSSGPDLEIQHSIVRRLLESRQ